MKSNSAVVNVGVNIVGAVTPLLVSLLYIPAMVDALGPGKYGLYSLLGTVLAYFGFFEFGIGRATTRYLLDAGSRWPDAQVVFHGVALTTLFGVVGTVLILCISPWIGRLAGTAGEPLHADFLAGMMLLALLLPVLFLESLFRCLLEAMNEFMVVNVLKIISALLVAGLIILMAGSGVESIVLFVMATVAVRLLFLIFHVVIWKVKSGLRFEMRWNRDIVVGMMIFGGWASVSMIIGPIMVNFDRFWIAFHFSNADVAYYTVPFDVITKLWLIPGALVAVLFPSLVRTGFQSEGGVPKKYEQLMFYAFLMSAVIVLPAIVAATFFADSLMSWWVDPHFAQASSSVLVILALAVFINVPAQILFIGLHAAGRSDVPAKLHLIEVPLYLALIFFLSQWLGLVGVAIAWLLRVVIDGLLLAWAYKQIVNAGTKLFKSMLLLVLTAALLGGVLCLPGSAWRLPVGGIFFLIAGGLALKMLYMVYQGEVASRGPNK